MRNCVVASMSALAAMFLCTTGAFAQSAQQPVTAKANANSTAFEPAIFPAFGIQRLGCNRMAKSIRWTWADIRIPCPLLRLRDS